MYMNKTTKSTKICTLNRVTYDVLERKKLNFEQRNGISVKVKFNENKGHVLIIGN